VWFTFTRNTEDFFSRAVLYLEGGQKGTDNIGVGGAIREKLLSAWYLVLGVQ
jgi:hypothetical protein